LEPVSAVKKAALARYVWLLQKVQANKQPLSGPELKELEKYEDEMKRRKATENTETTETTEIKKSNAKICTLNPVRYTLSPASIKLMALEGKSIAEAELLLSEAGSKSKTPAKSFSLNQIFDKKTDLKKAWDRGRFLYNLGRYAATATTEGEAEIQLKLAAGELNNIFKMDSEAADTWNQARHDKSIEIKEKLLDKNLDNLSPAALKQLEIFLFKMQAPDYARISIEEMEKLTGYSRRTFYRWFADSGLARNSDGTLNLAIFFRWHEKYITETKVKDYIDKHAINSEGIDITRVSIEQLCLIAEISRQTLHTWYKVEGLPRNTDGSFNLIFYNRWFKDYIIKTKTNIVMKNDDESLSDIKKQNLKLTIQQKLGQLLDRDSVLHGFAVRNKTTVDVIKRHLEPVKEPYIKQTIDKIFNAIREELSNIPEFLKLDEIEIEAFRNFLQILHSRREANQ
jgi:AraC-like DNA-binding protein